MYIDWDTVLTTGISSLISGVIVGVIVGVVLAILGNYFWKKQNYYSKKHDAFTTFNNLLYDFHSLLQGLLKGEKFAYYDNKINDLFLSLKPAYLNFAHYFETEHLKPIDDIMNVYEAIRHKTNTMNYDETLNYLNSRFAKIHSIRI